MMHLKYTTYDILFCITVLAFHNIFESEVVIVTVDYTILKRTIQLEWDRLE